MRYLIIPLFVSFTLIGCKSSQHQQPVTDEDKKASYDVVLSFFSPGNGIDRKAYQAFTDLISEDSSAFLIEKYTWGREGEMDFCINLNGNSKDKYLNRLQEIAENSSRTRFCSSCYCKRKSN